MAPKRLCHFIYLGRALVLGVCSCTRGDPSARFLFALALSPGPVHGGAWTAACAGDQFALSFAVDVATTHDIELSFNGTALSHLVGHNVTVVAGPGTFTVQCCAIFRRTAFCRGDVTSSQPAWEGKGGELLRLTTQTTAFAHHGLLCIHLHQYPPPVQLTR